MLRTPPFSGKPFILKDFFLLSTVIMFCLFVLLFRDRYICGWGLRLLGVPRSRAYLVTCCDVLRNWSDRSTLQVISVVFGWYSERTYLSREEAIMNIARGERVEYWKSEVLTTAEFP